MEAHGAKIKILWPITRAVSSYLASFAERTQSREANRALATNSLTRSPFGSEQILGVPNVIAFHSGSANFGIHALRHAATSLFIEQGWNPKKIQNLLGHASIAMTMDVYGHLFENAGEDVSMFEKLERDLLAA